MKRQFCSLDSEFTSSSRDVLKNTVLERFENIYPVDFLIAHRRFETFAIAFGRPRENNAETGSFLVLIKGFVCTERGREGEREKVARERNVAIIRWTLINGA